MSLFFGKHSLKTYMIMMLLGVNPALAASISKEEIIKLYSDSSSFSSDGKSINYYSPNGTYKSTNIKTGKQNNAQWYVTDNREICIKGKKERCWRLTQTKRKICFEASGNKFCRLKKDYLRGDQTPAHVSQ